MALGLGLAAFLAAYNNVLVLLPIRPLHAVPINIVVAGLLVAGARARGLSWDTLGLSADGVGQGLRWGGALAAVIAAGIGLALVVPGADGLLEDRRVLGIGAGELAAWVLIRIPFGTVLLEEVAFRGVLYGTLERAATVAWAVVGSSLVFGLWHVAPTLELLDANRPDLGAAGRALGVAGGVALTTLGGLLLAFLRARTGGIVAPALAHLAANSLAVLGAFAARP